MKKIISLLVVFLMLSACNSKKTNNNDIVTSFFPIQSLVSSVRNQETAVIVDSEAHDFEPTAKQRAQIAEAKQFYYHGLGMEYWFDESMLKEGKAIELSKEMKVLPSDPHTWLDPYNAMIMLDTIVVNLKEVEPEVEENALSVRETLTELIQEYDRVLSSQEGAIMMVDHLAFGYLADRYNLVQKPIIDGVSEGEATIKEVIASVELIKENNIKAIFVDPHHKTDVIDQIVKETNVEVLPLYTMEQAVDDYSYLDLLKINLESLEKGL
ncbi:MAG TPA: metal ABC transporter substrate-binding protein [Erysipelothrix sp.]